MARVVVQTIAVGAKNEPTSARYPVMPGSRLEIGRTADVPLGVDPEDAGVSRLGLTVAREDTGWVVTSSNANGAVIHPWGQAARWAEAGRPTEFRWPLVGVRLVGSQQNLHHWVLLEAPEQRLVPERPNSTNTQMTEQPAALTPAQLAAVERVFAPHLAWPPVAGASAVPLQAAAGRLGVTQAAVYQRLEAVRARAYQLGSHEQIGVSDPEYLYVLVRAGLIPSPPTLVEGPADRAGASTPETATTTPD